MIFQGVIFEVDGVLVDSPHSRTRHDALRELMDTERARPGYISWPRPMS
jgi:beta-phosphoglucomutase